MVFLERSQNQVIHGLNCGSFEHKEREQKKEKERKKKGKKSIYGNTSPFFNNKHRFIGIITFQLDKIGSFVRIGELRPM